MDLAPQAHKQTTILIIDSHTIFREGLRSLLDSEPDLHVVADTGDCNRMVELCRSLRPDILLFDSTTSKPRLRKAGIDGLRDLASAHHEVRTILLTSAIDDSQVFEALRCGVRGFVRKEENVALLIKSIRTVMAGEYWISRHLTSGLANGFASFAAPLQGVAHFSELQVSRREQQVIKAVLSGYSNKEIATELSISEQAVKYHLTNIFRKFGISGRMELARLSLERGLIR
jgi:two-component system, NarL family, nitrate/nitrite response regulator NarL